jgi:7 transmembrane receptor (rhodopsin family)
MSNTLHVVIYVVGFLENFVLLLAIARTWNVRTSLNIYLLGLTLVDLVCSAYSPVIFISFMIYSEWVLGITACYAFIYFDMLLVYLELFIVCAIFVLLSFFGSTSPRNVWISLVGFAVLLLIVSINLDVPDIEDKEACFNAIPSQTATNLLKVLGSLFLVLLFLLAKTAKKRYAFNYFGELKTNRLAMGLIVSYIIHWCPITFSTYAMEVNENYYYDYFSNTFSQSYLVVRPLLYFWTDEVLKTEFKSMWSTCFGHTVNRALLISEREEESSLDGS